MDWVSRFFKLEVSHKETCLSDILLNCNHTSALNLISFAEQSTSYRIGLTPVVAILSLSPNQATLEPFTPACPSVIRTASLPARGSNSLSFLSLQVFIHLSAYYRKYAGKKKLELRYTHGS